MNRSRSLKAVIGAVALATTVFVAAAPAGAKAGGNGKGNSSTNVSAGNVITWQYWCDTNGCYYFIPLT